MLQTRSLFLIFVILIIIAITTNLNPSVNLQCSANLKCTYSNYHLVCKVFYHNPLLCCYRDTKNGQQCCYDEDGSLITDPPGVGTTLRTNIIINPHFGYFENDYFSYLMCCEKSNKCKDYYDKRSKTTTHCS